VTRAVVPGEEPVTVACLHLGLTPAERSAHVRLLTGRVGDAPRLVMAGDLNEGPGSASWQGLAALVRDPAPPAMPTFPAHGPRRRIDAVLVGPGVAVLDYDSWRAAPRDLQLSSDHRPVLVVLR
jgi:endonuclease/exonuclease/phosphatase family metal-dependent hydrolase